MPFVSRLQLPNPAFELVGKYDELVEVGEPFAEAPVPDRNRPKNGSGRMSVTSTPAFASSFSMMAANRCMLS